MGEPRARLVVEGGRQSLWFWCPGCVTHHAIYIQPPPGYPSWTWDLNAELPTVSPSVKVTWEYGEPGRPAHVCHSFVRNGQIQFLSDCTHALAGKTVDISPIVESIGDKT